MTPTPPNQFHDVHACHLTQGQSANKVRTDNLRSRSPGKRTESDRAKCVDARPEKAAEADGNVRLSAHPSARWWTGPRPYRCGDAHG